VGLLLIIALSAANHLGDYSRFQLSRADTNRITSAEYGRCTDKALTNYDAVQCIGAEWDIVDRQLNENYRAALRKMPNGRAREQLRNAQRRWLRQSDEQCSVDNVGGHTPYELAIHQCEIEELIRRAAWLRHIAGS
jgi:uncharacterized protein YecT (DUF1311 family)